MMKLELVVSAVSSAPVRTERRWLEDHAGVRRAWAECAMPSSEDELRAVLRWAARAGRTVTLRGGGQCLHGQSVGDDLVVDLSALNKVTVDTRAGVVTAGGGARWADVRAALPPGWVLPNLVTTGVASVAGTLMADSASRFSSAFGREADGVRRARLMTADGTILDCDRTGAHAEIFGALPGSVGMLGALVSVEHALVDVRHLAARDGSMRVRTVVRKHPTARALLADLALELRAPRSRRFPRAAYGLLVRGCGAILFHSTYTHAPRARRMPNHRRRDALRAWTEQGFHIPAVNRALWWTIFTHYYRDGDHFVDDADDFTFFMDTGTAAPHRLVQQVIELPFDASLSACTAASALIAGCERLCAAYDMEPVVWDVLALRGEGTSHALRFTTAVGLPNPAHEPAARAFLSAQATLAAQHGARVLPGKSVYADADTLVATMREELSKLRRLKARLDPSDLFGGPFYERVLRPALVRAGEQS